MFSVRQKSGNIHEKSILKHEKGGILLSAVTAAASVNSLELR